MTRKLAWLLIEATVKTMLVIIKKATVKTKQIAKAIKNESIDLR